MRLLIDTNVLLRWSDRNDPCHPECMEAVERLVADGNRIYTCAQVLIEYWVVATSPVLSNGFGLNAAEARLNLTDARETFVCLPEPPDMADQWERIVQKHDVLGKQAHDARLVALMLSHGITQLLTLNIADFARYPEIAAVAPAQILG